MMKPTYVKADLVKPDYDRVKKAWAELLRPYYRPDGSLDPKFLLTVDCPACGSQKAEGEFSLSGFLHKTCSDCETVYVSPRLKDECLAKLYGDEYYNRMYTGSMIPAFETRKKLIGARKFAQIAKYQPGRGRVLDVGAGIGEVIDVFKDNGWDCSAIEMNPAGVSWLKGRGIAVHDGTFDTFSAPEPFDVIMAWGVVEHVVDPKGFLKKVRSLLKPGGLFVSEVPNGQSLTVDYTRRSGKDPQRIVMGEQHIVMYSVDAYKKLHSSAGFTELHVQTNGLDVETVLKIEDGKASDQVVLQLQACVDSYLKGDLMRGFWRA